MKREITKSVESFTETKSLTRSRLMTTLAYKSQLRRLYIYSTIRKVLNWPGL